MFFDDTFGGYWYQFAGVESSVDLGLTSSLSVDGELSFALGS